MLHTTYIRQCKIATLAPRMDLKKPKRTLPLFPDTGPLYFVANDVLGPLPKIVRNHHVVNMINRYFECTSAICTRIITSTNLDTTFFDNLILPYGIPNYVLTDDSAQFVSNFFKTLCLFLGAKKLKLPPLIRKQRVESKAVSTH